MVEYIGWEVIMFADDSSIIITGNNKDNLEINCNLVLRKLQDYLLENKMLINISKTSYMNFNNDTLNLNFEGQLLIRCMDTKILGININENLTFNNHCNIIRKKMLKVAYVFKNYNKKAIPLIAKNILFNSYVKSHLIFSSIYLNSLNKKYFITLNRAFNLIHKHFFGFKKPDLLENIIKEYSNKFIYNIIINKNPKNNYDILEKRLSKRKLLFILNKKTVKKLTFLHNLMANFNVKYGKR